METDGDSSTMWHKPTNIPFESSEHVNSNFFESQPTHSWWITVNIQPSCEIGFLKSTEGLKLTLPVPDPRQVLTLREAQLGDGGVGALAEAGGSSAETGARP